MLANRGNFYPFEKQTGYQLLWSKWAKSRVSYLFCGPSDQTVELLAYFTTETNGTSLTKWIILV